MKLSAAIVFGSLIGFAAASESVPSTSGDEKKTAADIEQTLQMGEEKLRGRLGEDMKVLEDLIRSLVEAFASKFGVEQKELAEVAQRALENPNIANEAGLKTALESLATGGFDLSSLEGVLEGLKTDGI
ncbi:hypothetical protein TGPRC2_243940 [Toxoplasma gondii TgCatPRC2]|uniref:Transmembrane protein n=4 Tax=Toxoplasma gondii TaxID=5811 RepID=A0A151HRN5_TOXGO|nr:hypothetical protein TGME49_243940 [Toxoplasma gondii ME49]EPT30513.1 hypothetical protein TGME49_243940 [Toxoplasma gondii ME49]KYF40997.1 hypothetical protein TGARI_243940 [Toxoplasma gondii ARI]KYK72066.1 hypothetical protein TGPRC2_243940 [Toxoplasma gondii TgCatPRC2]PIM02764.1 hypothetical protein TGCOUG_243940 [Toxoplasma gondii COUG]|eukprot:XP_002366883.1 hypothetical protein TGME49_243940 [Toxoplasma gondii ME49]